MTGALSDNNKPEPGSITDGNDKSSSLLQPLTAALLACVTPAEVVTVVVERGVAALGARAGLVVQVKEDQASGEKFLQIVAARGFSQEVLDAWDPFPLAASLPLSDAVREQTPLFSTGRADLEARYPEMFQQGPMHPVKASASLPLVARGRALGGLHFSFPEERDTYSPDDRAFLGELAHQCALALDRALLLEEVEAARASAEAAQAHQEFLSRASALPAESLDYQVTLESIVRLAVPALCDWMTVDMVAPAPIQGSDGSAGPAILDLAVAAHVDRAEVEALREMRRRSPIDMTQEAQPPVAAILSGETVVLPEITPEIVAASARNEEQRRHIERLAVRSLVSVPLRTASSTTPIGALTLVFTRASGRTFTPGTIALAEELGRRAAVAVDNARLYERAQGEIAERSRAEHHAEEIAADLRLITDAAPLLIAYVGTDLCYRFVNKGYADWFGFSQNEIIGRPAESVLGPAAFAKVRARLLAALAGERVSFEDTLAYGAAHVRHVHADYVPDRGQDGSIRGVVAVVSDITARREAEQAREAALATAEAARRQTEVVLESIGEMFFALDSAFRLTYVNRRVEEAWRKPRQELLGRVIWDVLPQAVGSASYHAQQEAMRERRVIRFEAVSLVLRRWIECSCYPSEDGGISVYFRDIQEQKEAEEALRASEHRFRALADNIAQLAWMADETGAIFWYNRRWFEYTGTTLEEMLGWNWRKVHHPDHVEAVTEKFREQVVAGEPWEDTFPLRGVDGQYRWFLSRAFPTRDESGRVVLWCGTNTDVTEQREAGIRQRRFLREMLLGFTDGRLRLCDSASDLPKPLSPLSKPVELTATTMRRLRKQVMADAEALQLPLERLQDFETAVGEASMNAVQHGRGGTGRVHGDPETGVIQVWIEDQGEGIAEDFIHRAIEQGWTTGGFGQGFFLMRSCADRIYLLTGPGGTTVVLEQERVLPEPKWFQ